MTPPEGRGWSRRGYLPHFDSDTVIQHVTFRLADSLPREVLLELRQALLAEPPEKQDIERRKRIEACLDRGYGCCALRDPANAEVAQAALLHFDGVRYEMHAWVIMPNHVHALLRTNNGRRLGSIVGSWKAHAGKTIGDWCRQRGTGLVGGHVWYRDYWDRFIRDERHYAAAVGYIHRNPVTAGLVKGAGDWKWSSVSAPDHPRL